MCEETVSVFAEMETTILSLRDCCVLHLYEETQVLDSMGDIGVRRNKVFAMQQHWHDMLHLNMR